MDWHNQNICDTVFVQEMLNKSHIKPSIRLLKYVNLYINIRMKLLPTKL